jgi:hypothetical protein
MHWAGASDGRKVQLKMALYSIAKKLVHKTLPHQLNGGFGSSLV